MERGLACLDRAGIGELLLQCGGPVRVPRFRHRQLDVEVALNGFARGDDALGDGLELLLIPGDFLGQILIINGTGPLESYLLLWDGYLQKQELIYD